MKTLKAFKTAYSAVAGALIFATAAVGAPSADANSVPSAHERFVADVMVREPVSVEVKVSGGQEVERSGLDQFIESVLKGAGHYRPSANQVSSNSAGASGLEPSHTRFIYGSSPTY